MDGESEKPASVRFGGTAALDPSGGAVSPERLVETAYRRHGAYIFRHASLILGDANEAWDVVQQVFFSFLQHLRAGNPCRHTRAFLCRAATRLSIRRAKGWLWRRKPLRAVPEEYFLREGVPAELTVAVRRAYQELRPKDRAVLEALLIDQMNQAEIQTFLGFPPTTLKRIMRRIYKQLKRQGVEIEKKVAPNDGLAASIYLKREACPDDEPDRPRS